MGCKPALWAASKKSGTFARAHISAASAIGISVPFMFETCTSTTSLTSERSIRLKIPRSRVPSVLHGIISIFTPREASFVRGRITELCSIAEKRTRSPGLSQPFRTRLMLSVAFLVNTTRSGSLTPSIAAALRLQPATMAVASLACLCAPLPGEAPTLSSTLPDASITAFGLGKLVAALSRYTDIYPFLSIIDREFACSRMPDESDPQRTRKLYRQAGRRIAADDDGDVHLGRLDQHFRR